MIFWGKVMRFCGVGFNRREGAEVYAEGANGIVVLFDVILILQKLDL